MYECPNCGGNLRFDIQSQMLACDFCHTYHDPYSVTKEHDAVEQDMYDVTVFTCPQCGGEILSTENSAAEFCSFCGASTILTSRISKEKRPNYIIPFKKDKEDCKNAYAKFIKHALFAPKELKDPQYLDRFRGIYMPYWAYYVTQEGNLNLKGKKEYRSGDYIYTDTYHLGGQMHSYYKGLSYDASSSFSDTISQNIAPYDVREMKAFTPSYLSGFYADTADVDSSLYRDDAIQTANKHSYNSVKSLPEFRGLKIDTPANDFSLSSAFCTDVKQTDSAMFPVWFLSYRKGNRVSYATVNGQTGKIAADLPIDIGKYFLGSLLLALPLFIILNLFFTLKPVITLAFSSILALVAAIIYVVELSQIQKRDAKEDDLGYLSKKEGPNSFHISQKRQKQHKSGNGMPSGFRNFFNVVNIVVVVCLFVTFSSIFLGLIDNLLHHTFLIYGIIFIGAVITTIYGVKISQKTDIKNGVLGFVGSLAAILISSCIALINPVSDLFYYGGTIMSYLATFFTLLSIIRKYNILASRKLPQFEKRGGEEYENR